MPAVNNKNESFNNSNDSPSLKDVQLPAGVREAAC